MPPKGKQKPTPIYKGKRKAPEPKQLTRKEEFLLKFKLYKNPIIAFFIITAVLTAIIVGIVINAEDNTQDENLPTLIEIGSSTCQPCRMLQPILQDLKRDHSNKVNVVIYDTGTPKGSSMSTKYNVETIPTMIFVDKNGIERSRMTGYKTKEQIEAEFRRLGWI